MNFLQKIRESPNYTRLKNSEQYRYDKRQFIIISVCFGIIFLLFLPMMILAAGSPSAAVALFYLVLLVVGYFLVWAFYTYTWLEIFRHMDSYIFFQARLDQPHIHGRGGVSFTVKFTDCHGKQQQKETSKMFSSQWEPLLEDYNNQLVLMGYNEETDRLVLIDRVQTGERMA